MVEKNLADGLKQRPTWERQPYDMIESIANMQGKINEYESFIEWAIDFMSFKGDYKREFNDVRLRYLEDVIRNKFTHRYENTSTWGYPRS